MKLLNELLKDKPTESFNLTKEKHSKHGNSSCKLGQKRNFPYINGLWFYEFYIQLRVMNRWADSWHFWEAHQREKLEDFMVSEEVHFHLDGFVKFATQKIKIHE